MTGLIAYVVLSVIMSIVWTITIVKETDISMFCKTTRVCFVAYFIFANLFAWPVYNIYIASYILHDYHK